MPVRGSAAWLGGEIAMNDAVWGESWDADRDEPWLWGRLLAATRKDATVSCDPAARWAQVGNELNQGWRAEFDGRTVQLFPLGDLVDHDLTSDTCLCGVALRILRAPSGAAVELVSHHALDGRDADAAARSGGARG